MLTGVGIKFADRCSGLAMSYRIRVNGGSMLRGYVAFSILSDRLDPLKMVPAYCTIGGTNKGRPVYITNVKEYIFGIPGFRPHLEIDDTDRADGSCVVRIPKTLIDKVPGLDKILLKATEEPITENEIAKADKKYIDNIKKDQYKRTLDSLYKRVR